MSLFNDPREHAANGPATWTVVKAGRRFAVRTAHGVTLDTCERKRDAVELCQGGHLVTLYGKESRWYRGERVDNWQAYVHTCDVAGCVAGVITCRDCNGHGRVRWARGRFKADSPHVTDRHPLCPSCQGEAHTPCGCLPLAQDDARLSA